MLQVQTVFDLNSWPKPNKTCQLFFNYVVHLNKFKKKTRKGSQQPAPLVQGTAAMLSLRKKAGHTFEQGRPLFFPPPKEGPDSGAQGLALLGPAEAWRSAVPQRGHVPTAWPGDCPGCPVPTVGQGGRQEAALLPNPTSTSTYLWQAGSSTQPVSGGALGSHSRLSPGPAVHATETPSKAITKPVGGRRKGVVLVSFAGNFFPILPYKIKIQCLFYLFFFSL